MNGAYLYWLVRDVPDVVRGEQVNVAVIVGQDGGDWAIRVAPDLRRGMPRRWRRSHRHLRLMPSLRASSVSVMWSWCSSTKCWK